MGDVIYGWLLTNHSKIGPGPWERRGGTVVIYQFQSSRGPKKKSGNLKNLAIVIYPIFIYILQNFCKILAKVKLFNIYSIIFFQADICSMNGSLAFLVALLRHQVAQIVENGGGILRNISSFIAMSEDGESYR